MPDEPQEIQLQSGYYFSPGFFMEYWSHSIIPNFSSEVVAFGGRLKLHREAWIGAQLAAMKTKLSGEKYYFSLPERDPPDVLVGTFHPITTPLGRSGTNLDFFPVENTRCDVSMGETLIAQIQNKNTHAYTGVVLLVYLQGAEVVPNLEELHAQIGELDAVLLHEIIVMVQLPPSDTEDSGMRFGFVQVYPNYDTAIVNRNDSGAYFVEPNIMRITGRGVQENATRLGSIKLMPPN